MTGKKNPETLLIEALGSIAVLGIHALQAWVLVTVVWLAALIAIQHAFGVDTRLFVHILLLPWSRMMGSAA